MINFSEMNRIKEQNICRWNKVAKKVRLNFSPRKVLTNKMQPGLKYANECRNVILWLAVPCPLPILIGCGQNFVLRLILTF